VVKICRKISCQIYFLETRRVKSARAATLRHFENKNKQGGKSSGVLIANSALFWFLGGIYNSWCSY